jgi:hypothetical protein
MFLFSFKPVKVSVTYKDWTLVRYSSRPWLRHHRHTLQFTVHSSLGHSLSLLLLLELFVVAKWHREPVSTVTCQSYLTTDGQSASLSWYQPTIWDPRPIFLSFPRKLSKDFFLVWDALSDEKVSLSATESCLRCHPWIQVPQNWRPYLTVSFETGFPFCHLLRLAEIRWRFFVPPLELPHPLG